MSAIGANAICAISPSEGHTTDTAAVRGTGGEQPPHDVEAGTRPRHTDDEADHSRWGIGDLHELSVIDSCFLPKTTCVPTDVLRSNHRTIYLWLVPRRTHWEAPCLIPSPPRIAGR
jgi:hypothetical protein